MVSSHLDEVLAAAEHNLDGDSERQRTHLEHLSECLIWNKLSLNSLLA